MLPARPPRISPTATRMPPLLHNGALYGMIHAAALLAVVGIAERRGQPGLPLTFAGWSFAAGIVLFSLSLFALASTGIRWVGRVTPFGGAALFIGWAALGTTRCAGADPIAFAICRTFHSRVARTLRSPLWPVPSRYATLRRLAAARSPMTTLLYTHPACLEHDPGSHNPESPARLRAVLEALAEVRIRRARATRGAGGGARRSGPRASAAACRAPARRRARIGSCGIDADTVLSPPSGTAALRAAGAVVAAVDAVVAGEADNAFCAVRPPGHHAEPSRAMGFCLFNNAAIGAARACAVHGLDRVAVVDFDVHHGNGTQAAFAEDGRFFYASTHQYPLYPGTGAASETGIGNIVNVPLRPNSGSGQFRLAMSQRILPALDRFRPELIVISAGFDGHRRDPLAQLMLEDSDYTWITES